MSVTQPLVRDLPSLHAFATFSEEVYPEHAGKCRGRTYLARHFPHLKVDFIGHIRDDDRFVDDYIHQILQLAGHCGDKVKRLELKAGISQLCQESCSPRLEYQGRVNLEENGIQSLERLELDLAQETHLGKIFDWNADPRVFPPFEDEDDVSTDFSQMLQWILGSASSLKQLRIAIPSRDPEFRMEEFSWTAKNLDWDKLTMPCLETLYLEDAMINATKMSSFLTSHSSTLKHVGFVVVQVEERPCQGWKEILTTIRERLRLSSVAIHTCPWYEMCKEMPLIQCPKMEGDAGFRKGKQVSDRPKSLRAYLTHQAPWSPELDALMGDKTPEDDWEDEDEEGGWSEDDDDTLDDMGNAFDNLPVSIAQDRSMNRC